jgi:uncharacterized protein YehS (DUF1456 family)
VTNNDFLKSIRYLLNVRDPVLVQICAVAGYEVPLSDIVNYLKNEEDVGYVDCPHLVMAHFLNGLIIHKRGKDESRPPLPVQVPVTNNMVLKKLRVAYELKDTDLITMIENAGLRVSKTELSAFFRAPDHRNYRECGDQFLRNVLKGLRT